MRRALSGLRGVTQVGQRPGGSAFDVVYDPARVKPKDIEAAITNAGFFCSVN